MGISVEDQRKRVVDVLSRPEVDLYISLPSGRNAEDRITEPADLSAERPKGIVAIH